VKMIRYRGPKSRVVRFGEPIGFEHRAHVINPNEVAPVMLVEAAPVAKKRKKRKKGKA